MDDNWPTLQQILDKADSIGEHPMSEGESLTWRKTRTDAKNQPVRRPAMNSPEQVVKAKYPGAYAYKRGDIWVIRIDDGSRVRAIGSGASESEAWAAAARRIEAAHE